VWEGLFQWSSRLVSQCADNRQSEIANRQSRGGCERGLRLIESPGVYTPPNQNDGFEFRADVKRIWDEFQRIEKSREFGNLEGGSVEQHRDRRLQLHHCANYAAVLNVLRDGCLGTRSQFSEEIGSCPSDSVMSRAPLRLLEFGCGSGVLTSALARVMPNDWTIEATDYSEHLLTRARERFERDGLSFSHLDVRSIRPEHLDEIDAVLLLEVIEHLPPDEAEGLLHRVYDALPVGGMMVLTTLDRAAFPRPFSGYAPHFVEYTYSSLDRFLGDRRRSPFEAYDVFRLVSDRLVSESVKAEERGGYLMNRAQRLLLGLGRRHAELGAFRGWVESRLFHLYSFLPDHNGFDFKGYLSTLDFIRSEPELHDRDSFGLVAVLRKTGAVASRGT
jgi:2-polyprenyl-3-methyl-5-hydroxy-6-metoxy-1,4-benzoquinol methylase